MAVTYINSGSGTATGTTNGTITITLSAAPTAGQWVFVAVMSGDPVNMNPGTVRCGTIILNAIDLGDEGSGNLGPRPALYGAPFQTGMTTSVTVPWINSLGISRQIVAATLVLGGMASTPTTAYAHLRTLNSAGLFDGTCGPLTTDIGGNVGSTSVSSNVLTYTSSTGIRTAYDSQKQPFILATWQALSAYTAPSTISGAATIANGVITTTGQTSGTLVLASATTYGTTGTAYLLTTDGVVPFAWTGKTGNNLTGCTIYGGSASGFYNYSLTTGTGASINHPVLIQTALNSTAQPFNGWQMGINATTGIGVSVATTAATGGLAAGQLTLSFGQSDGLSSTPAYLITGSSTAGSSLFTLVPSTRKMSRGSNVVDSINAITKKRVAKTIQVILNDAVLIRKLVVKTAKAANNNIALIRKNVSKRIKAAINNISLIRKNIIKKIKAAYTNAASITSRKSNLKNVIMAYSNPFVIGRTLRTNRRSTAQQTNSLISNRRYASFRSAISTYNINAYFIRAIRRSKKAYTTYNNAATASRVINRTRLSTVRILQLFNINRIKRYNKKASAAISNAAVVTRTRNYGRFGKVTISYSIASTRRRSSIRIAIATVNAIAKNIANRPFYIFTSERANTVVTLASVSETITNNVDVVGDYTVENDLNPTDYNETAITTPVDFVEPNDPLPNDYTEPDNPTGEDVVPT